MAEMAEEISTNEKQKSRNINKWNENKCVK